MKLAILLLSVAILLLGGTLLLVPRTTGAPVAYTYKEFRYTEHTRYRDWRLDEDWHAPVADILTDASTLGWDLTWTDGHRYLLRRPYVPHRKPDPRWLIFEPDPVVGSTSTP